MPEHWNSICRYESPYVYLCVSRCIVMQKPSVFRVWSQAHCSSLQVCLYLWAQVSIDISFLWSDFLWIIRLESKSVFYGDESFVLFTWVIGILNSLFFCLGSHWENHDSSAILMMLIQPYSPPAVSTKCLQVACREFCLSRKVWSTHFTQTFLLCKFVVIIGLFPNFKQIPVLVRRSILRKKAQNTHAK